tara:strand:+ start:13383 stop:14102 length:720 start_codon:yes stop_codon:yes gene_type:complete
MAITTINVGNIANDGTGDDLREAFIKVNDNFNEVDSRLVDTATTATNLGVTGEGVYASSINGTLQFKKLLPGANTSLISNDESITISSVGGMSELLVAADEGGAIVSPTNYLGLNGSGGITTRASGNNVIIELNNTGVLSRDTAPTLSANLQANNKNIQNANVVSATSFVGDLTGNVHGVDIRTINQFFVDYWDFGDIIDRNNYDSIIEFMMKDYVVDFGDLIGTGKKEFIVDLGSIST